MNKFNLSLSNRVTLVFLLLCQVWSFVAPAQTTKNLALKENLKFLSQELLKSGEKNYRQALELSQSNQWPIEQKRSDGRIIVLQGIDAQGAPIYYSINSLLAVGQTTKTSSLYAGGSLGVNLSGSSASVSNKIGLWDSGRALITHQELTPRVKTIEGVNYASDHATHLAGVLVGKGVNKIAKGMAPGASLKTWDFSNDVYEMTLAASDLLISNHSYGVLSGWVFNPDRPGTNDDLKWEWWGDENISKIEDYKFGFYDNKSKEVDRIATLAPYYLIVKSADNKRSETGPPIGTRHYIRNTNTTSTAIRSTNGSFDTIPTDATAKNILTIGAVGEILKANPEPKDVLMTAFSSWGPTDDGRIKPDLMGMGVDVTSSVATSNTAYNAYTGTSVAAPNVAGSLLLLQEYYAQLNAGKLMRSSTLKGLAIHTATEAGTAPGPDYQFGWGLLNIEKAAKVIANPATNLIQEVVLGQGSSYSVNVVATGKEPLVTTLAWIDPEGIPHTSALLNNRTPKLINDLDIRIFDGSSTSLPWVLDPGNPLRAASVGDNTVDNVEQVNLPVPVAGKVYTISISHKGSLINNSQAFSLIVGGISKVGCQMTVGVSPSGNQILCKGGLLKLSASTGTNFTYQWTKDGVNIAGATAFSYFVSQPGKYQVKILQGTCSAISQVVNVALSDLAATVNTANGTAVCNGSSLSLAANTSTNYSYQWIKDNANMPGITTSSISITRTGNYSVKITEKECSVTSAAVKVTGSSLTANISPAGSVTLCTSGEITLSANTGSSFSYQWFRNGVAIANATGFLYKANMSGSYMVQITAGSCSDFSDATEVIIGGVKADIQASSTSLCTGNIVLSTNTGSGFTYQWFRDEVLIKNAMGAQLVVNQAGKYAVKITSNNKCSGTSANVEISGGVISGAVKITPQSSTIFFNGSSVLIQLDNAPSTNLGYQWYRDNVAIANATGSSYRAYEGGAYKLVVGKSSCASTSNAVYVAVLNAFDALPIQKPILFSKVGNTIETSLIHIFPNPANTFLKVEYLSPVDQEEAIATIYSPMGIVIKSQSLRKISAGVFRDEISLENISNGRYFVSVAQGNESLSKAFVKQE
jgi:hypothetical protein